MGFDVGLGVLIGFPVDDCGLDVTFGDVGTVVGFDVGKGVFLLIVGTMVGVLEADLKL